MNEAIALMKVNFSEETNLDTETTDKVFNWLETEGALDYDIVRQTYSEGVRD